MRKEYIRSTRESVREYLKKAVNKCFPLRVVNPDHSAISTAILLVIEGICQIEYFAEGELKLIEIKSGDALLLNSSLPYKFLKEGAFQVIYFGINSSTFYMITSELKDETLKERCQLELRGKQSTISLDYFENKIKNSHLNESGLSFQLNLVKILFQELFNFKYQTSYYYEYEALIYSCNIFALLRFPNFRSQKEVAAIFGLSSRYLYELHLKNFNVTFKKELIFYRLHIVVNLLRQSKVPIYKIADYTGFSSHEHLCLAFKKIYGISPLKFRKSHRNEVSKHNDLMFTKIFNIAPIDINLFYSASDHMKHNAVIFRLMNRTLKELYLYWINMEKEKIFFGTILPRENLQLNTFPSHAWLILDCEKMQVAAFRILNDHCVAEIR